MSVLSSTGKKLETDVTLHPGELINSEIEEREISIAKCAELMGINEYLLRDIIKGKKHVTLPIALQLETVLLISAKFWMGLQSDYNKHMRKLKKSK